MSMGEKTQLLWQNPKYREHMSRIHKGQVAWNKGFKRQDWISDDINEFRKEKIKKTLIDKYRKGERKSALLGTKSSIFTRIKISQSIKKAYKEGRLIAKDFGKTSQRQKAMHNIDYRIWRENVFKKDDYTCQHCGIKSGNGKHVNLNADHIKTWAQYPELRYVLSNGQTLCVNCHYRKTSEDMKKK